VTNNNSKKRQKIIVGDADDKLEAAPMKKRRRLERDEALPLVCRLPACIKWQALGDMSEMEIYVKGVRASND
jgi:hypothetical protein